jgi:hypothetical protein
MHVCVEENRCTPWRHCSPAKGQIDSYMDHTLTVHAPKIPIQVECTSGSPDNSPLAGQPWKAAFCSLGVVLYMLELVVHIVHKYTPAHMCLARLGLRKATLLAEYGVQSRCMYRCTVCMYRMSAQ